jgi:hypothetical protein
VVGGAVSLLILLVSATSAFAGTGTGGGGLGAAPNNNSAPFVKWVLVDGKPVPTATGTPQKIVNVINAATVIAFKKYIYGGGHSYYIQKNGKTKVDAGYDCSGSVSFALHSEDKSGNFLKEPEDSGSLESWGKGGKGKWITVYTNSEHAYLVVAGLRFDTVAAQESESKKWKFGDRWNSNVSAGSADTAAAFVARHPTGW